MENFEVLDVTCSENSWINKRLKISVRFKDEIILFFYSPNRQQEWQYRNAFFSNDTHLENMYFHFKKLDDINKNKTWENFYETTEHLAPTLLNHPKVRIKMIFCK